MSAVLRMPSQASDRDRVERALREEIADLKEQLAFIQAPFVDPPKCPRKWKLTRFEAAVFALLVGRDTITPDMVRVVKFSLNGGKDSGEETDIKVHVYRMRRKLAAFNVVIETVWGQGYALQDRAHWRKVLEAGQ